MKSIARRLMIGWAWLGMALSVGSCTGRIGDNAGEPGVAAQGQPGDRRPPRVTGPGGQGGRATDSAGSDRGPPAADVPRAMAAKCTSPATRGVARESVRRLTVNELRSTLADLLPVGTRLDGDINAIADLPRNGAPEQFVPLYSDGQAKDWMGVAGKVGDLVASDAKLRAAVSADPCFAGATIADACWKTAVRRLLRRALRRPVTEEEVGIYASTGAGQDVPGRMHNLMVRVLMAPDFLFHIEEGGDVSGKRVRLTDHEVASRISYAVTGSMPDAALSDAADGGKLKTLADVVSQVRRLMVSPRASDRVRDFFGAWMNVEEIDGPDANLYKWAKLPGDPTAAATELTRDVADFVDNVVLKENGTLADVMTKKASYTRSPMLQAIYGSPGAAVAGQPYETPNHAGLAMRAAFVTGGELNTNPITRGVHFLRRILCEPLPPPDPALLAMREDVDVNPLTTPNFEMTTKMTRAPVCQACHARINTIGYTLEAYDPLGRIRSEQPYLDIVVAPNGATSVKAAATFPLPPAQNIKLNGLEATVANPGGLVAAAVASPRVGQCVSTFLVRHLQRRGEEGDDQCALDEVTSVLRSGAPMLDGFVQSVANEDIFWRGL